MSTLSGEDQNISITDMNSSTYAIKHEGGSSTWNGHFEVEGVLFDGVNRAIELSTGGVGTKQYYDSTIYIQRNKFQNNLAYTGYLVNLHESYVDESVYLYDNDYSAIVGSTCYSKINVITDMYSSKYIVASNNSFVNTRGTKIYMEDVRHGSSMTPLGGYYNIAASGNTVTCTGYSSYCGGSGIVIEGYRNTSTTGYCSAK